MPSAPQTIPLVQVWDYLMVGNVPQVGVDVFVTLNYSQASFSGPIVAQIPLSFATKTDANGYWSVSVPANLGNPPTLTPSGTLYSVQYAPSVGYKPFLIQVTNIGVPGVGWQAQAIAVSQPLGIGVFGYTLPGGTVVNGNFQVNGYLMEKAGPDFNIAAYGGAMDARLVTDAGMTNGQALLNSATFAFTQGDVGKVVVVLNAGPAGVPLQSTIVSVQSATQATLAANASATVNGQQAILGTDNGPAWVAAYTAAVAAGAGTLTCPPGAGLMLSPFAVNVQSISMRLPGVGGCIFYGVGALGSRTFEFQINPFNTGQAGEFYGWTIDGTFAQPGAIGYQWGEMTGGEIDNVVVQNFTAGPTSAGSRPSDGVSVGMYWVNRTNWTERTHVKRVWLSNNSVDWLVDVVGSAFTSFGYTRVKDLRLNTNANQIGMKWMGTANMYNSDLTVLGNYVGPGSTFWQMGDTGTATNGFLVNCRFMVTAELMNGPGGANGLIINAGSQMSGSATINLQIGTPVNTNNGLFSVAGSLNLPGIISRNGAFQSMGGIEIGSAGTGAAAIQFPGASSDGTSLTLSALNGGGGGILFRPQGNQVAGGQALLQNSGNIGFLGQVKATLDTGINFVADSPNVTNKRTRFDFQSQTVGQWSILMDRNQNGGTDFNLYDLINSHPALGLVQGAAGTSAVQAYGQLYPGAQAGGLQTTGGFLHASAVPSNSNGNNNDWCIVDTGQAGHLYFKTGGVWVDKTAYANSQSTPGNPAGTTNLVGVMMGLAGAFTPVSTGQVEITVSGDLANNTAGDGAAYQIRTGTGTAPVNGAALSGTTRGSKPVMIAAAANQQVPFSMTVIITGLTLGTAIWIDLALAAVTGGTATAADITITAREF